MSSFATNCEVKRDPRTGWLFFVDHTARTTTWNDPRWICNPANFKSRRTDFVHSLPQEMKGQLNLLSGYREAAGQLVATIGTISAERYKELEEKLTSLLLLVDGVKTEGQPEMRAARKEVVCFIQYALQFLDGTNRYFQH